MQILPMSEATELTSPCHQVWADAHRHAWALWQDRLLNDPEFVKPLTSSERYAILHRHITDYASRHLDGVVGHAPSLDFFAQVLDGRALVRFKHVDSDLKPRAYPTDQQQHLDRQEFTERIAEQLAFDGFPPAMTVLTVGFTLTLGEDNLGQIVVVCRTPELAYWYSILDAGEGYGDASGGEIQPMPGIAPPGPRVTSRRRPAQADGTDAR